MRIPTNVRTILPTVSLERLAGTIVYVSQIGGTPRKYSNKFDISLGLHTL